MCSLNCAASETKCFLWIVSEPEAWSLSLSWGAVTVLDPNDIRVMASSTHEYPIQNNKKKISNGSATNQIIQQLIQSQKLNSK